MPNHKILVADDNHDAADSLADLLKAVGYDARAVYDGQEALDAGRAMHPELALLDVQMPRVDGCEAARQMREGADAPAHIASISGLSPDEEPIRSLGGAFDAHFRKPLDPDQVLAFVRGRLGPPDDPH